mgnify:CR=1 FL=1
MNTTTWATMSRLLEATVDLRPTQQIHAISKYLTEEEADVVSIVELLALDYNVNNIGTPKAIKWIAKTFDIFEEEIKGYYNAYNSDLGEAIYRLEFGKETEEHKSVKSILRLLSMPCSKLSGEEFEIIKDTLLKMSALERKWFIRYWLRTPRNGINEGLVAKILGDWSSRKNSEVKKHLTLNAVGVVAQHYVMSEDPPMNLEHGLFVKPMLAKEVPMNKWPRDKIVDYKYDGNRYQIHKEGVSVIIFNRKGNIVTRQFQDVVEKVREYEVDCILDGEIYPIKEDGSPAEHKLMATRVHSKNHEEAMEKVKVKWVIFDCLKYKEVTIMQLPYWHRLEILKQLPDQAHRMQKDGNVIAFYNNAINDGFEGIIVKDANMPYEAGKRSIGWAKYKPPRIELDVVITGARYGEGKKANVFASFDISVSSNRGFVPIGSVGTGFSDEDLVSLTRKLRMHIESYDDKTHLVSPLVVLEVSADLVSRDLQGNIGLRFPRCKRIREDKYVADINTLEDLENLE